MTEIPRYRIDAEDADTLYVSNNGPLCKWADVEALQKALQEMTAQALAAVWLIPDDETPITLRNLRAEARRVFMGKDKQIIAKLQDELGNSQETNATLRQQNQALPPSIGSVYVRDRKHNLDTLLRIFEIRHDSGGNVHIGVYLP